MFISAHKRRIASNMAYVRKMMQEHPELQDAYQRKLESRPAVVETVSNKEKVQKAITKTENAFDEMEKQLKSMKGSKSIVDCKFAVFIMIKIIDISTTVYRYLLCL